MVSSERKNIRTAFEFYLPNNVVAQLSQGIESIRHQRLVCGTCLFTDPQNDTRIAEKMAPTELSRFVNRYLHVLFEPVRRSGGVISDVREDSILAIWPAKGPGVAGRTHACRAALEMHRAVETLQPVRT
ncbi:MAG: adenylate/guanylate cyclase domain-containing protein [Desulfobacterales bacterium]|nr:adenylate/guanylate cyclase domain-containing protein [Desulfobacterales bacterium]